MRVAVKADAAKVLRSQYESCVRRHSKEHMSTRSAVNRRAAERLLLNAWKGVEAALMHNVEPAVPPPPVDDSQEEREAQQVREEAVANNLRRLQVQVDDMLVTVTELRRQVSLRVAAAGAAEHTAYLDEVEQRLSEAEASAAAGKELTTSVVELPLNALTSEGPEGYPPYAEKLRTVVEATNNLPAKMQSQKNRAERLRKAMAMEQGKDRL